MKTFYQLLEREFSNPYLKSDDVPEDRKEYPKIVQVEILKRLEPFFKAAKINPIEVRPAWFWDAYSRPGKSGAMRVDIDIYELLQGNSVTFTFFSIEDAEEAKKFLERTSIDPNLSVQKNKWTLDAGKMLKIAKEKNISVDIKAILDFSEQCFYQEGPDWEDFKKKHRGALSGAKFGI
jgi:hypothetical protein